VFKHKNRTQKITRQQQMLHLFFYGVILISFLMGVCEKHRPNKEGQQ
jgi:hypothetical protein